jgi:hypothetical protein
MFWFQSRNYIVYLLFINESSFLFPDQEKLITNLGSDNQEARKEIISLKEQLASTSQVSLSKLRLQLF